MDLVDHSSTVVDVEGIISALGIEAQKSRGPWIDALCPLHEESSASFSINVEEGHWVCWHGRRGQLVGLVAEVRGISKSEAREWMTKFVAADLGTAEVLRYYLPKDKPVDDGELREWKERYDRLDPNTMSEYWFSRGFNERSMFQFHVRYDDSQKELIWPINGAAGDLISFVKRRLPNPNRKRYLYPKGFHRRFFPLDHFNGGDVILVEGPLDAIWLHQHGYSETLAMLGSSLSHDQMAWLQRGKVREVTLVLDNDDVGRRITLSLVSRLSKYLAVNVVKLEGVKDVQELSEPELSKVLQAKVPAMVFMIEMLTA